MKFFALIAFVFADGLWQPNEVGAGYRTLEECEAAAEVFLTLDDNWVCAEYIENE